MPETREVTNKNGYKFLVKIVRKGDKYGRNNCMTHDKEDPLVEFYDLKQANQKCWGPEGQFVSSYYRSTLLEGNKGNGLNLQGGVPAWQVDGGEMDKVREWLGERVCSDCRRDLHPDETVYCEGCGKQRAFEADASATIDED